MWKLEDTFLHCFYHLPVRSNLVWSCHSQVPWPLFAFCGMHTLVSVQHCGDRCPLPAPLYSHAEENTFVDELISRLPCEFTWLHLRNVVSYFGGMHVGARGYLPSCFYLLPFRVFVTMQFCGDRCPLPAPGLLKRTH